MNAITTTLVDDINRHHAAACQSAQDAVNHAMEAGKLLLQAKGAMTHGKWLPWLEENIRISPRQVQRYIAVAQGKTLPIRASSSAVVSHDRRSNTTSVSHLHGENAALSLEERQAKAPDWMPRPVFLPQNGHWYFTGPEGSGDGPMSFVVEPSEHAGFFFISHLYDNGDIYDCTRRPVRADWVEESLQFYGLADAAKATWHVRASPGVRVALETINTEETNERNIQRERDFIRGRITRAEFGVGSEGQP